MPEFVCYCGQEFCPDLDITLETVKDGFSYSKSYTRLLDTPGYVNQDGPLVSALKTLRHQDVDDMLQCRAGGAVQRCHTVRHQGSYSNAEHSWGVAMLLWYLFPQEAKRLVFYALTHDVPEGLTGDVPSTAKDHQDSGIDDHINRSWSLPAMGSLDKEDHYILKSCDQLELYLWGKEQLAQGNAYALEITQNIEKHFANKATGVLHPIAREYYNLICDRNIVPNRIGLMRKMKESYVGS